MKNAITILFLVVLSYPVSAVADWSGDITNGSVVTRPFGYLSTTSEFHGNTELKMVCFGADSVWLYLDTKITNSVPAAKVAVYVDQLPVNNLRFQPIGENYTITNSGSGFWKLIAQMSAGVVLKVDIDGVEHRYDLIGFSKAYNDHCGWVNSANNYRTYLASYR